MNVLVTGGAGFIGSHVVEEHLEKGHTVFVVDDLSMGSISNLPKSENLIFFEESITNSEFMTKLLIDNIDVIYLLAAIASVADTIQRPMESHKVNQEANIQILETIRINKLPVSRVIFASSAAVYGDIPGDAKREDVAVKPSTPYAIDKYATERFVLTYADLYGIPTVSFRFFNVFGPRQNPNSPYSGVLSIIAESLKRNKTFKLFGDGQQTRDFVFVKDVVSAMQIAENDDEMVGQVYNIGTGTSRTLMEAIHTFEVVGQRKLSIQTMPERVGDIKKSGADITKIRQFGYAPQYSFSDGVSQYWDSVKD